MPDHLKVGREMRLLRKKARVGLREIARRMGFSAPFVLDLEHGRRNWTDEKVADYLTSIRSNS